MKWIDALIKKLHLCNYTKPIISRYIGFNTRHIVYECRCGKRQILRDCRPFDEPFPIETTPFITHEDLKKIVNKKNRQN